MHLRRHLQQFQSTQPHRLGLGSRLVGLLTCHQGHVFRNKPFVRTATASDDVHQSLVNHLSHMRCHRLWCLVVEPHRVRQSCIGIGTDVIRCAPCQLAQEGQHLRRTERAVQTHREDGIAADAGKESLQRLSAECAPCQVADGSTQHDGQLRATLLHHRHGGIDSHLGIQRVEYRFYQQGIHPTRYQSVCLFAIRLEQFVVRHVTRSRITDVGRHRARLVRRSYTACHEAGFFR